MSTPTVVRVPRERWRQRPTPTGPDDPTLVRQEWLPFVVAGVLLMTVAQLDMLRQLVLLRQRLRELEADR